MENIWAVLKANVSDYKSSSIKELIRIIKKKWKKLNKRFAENLVNSMKKRISDVISNKGDHILF